VQIASADILAVSITKSEAADVPQFPSITYEEPSVLASLAHAAVPFVAAVPV
jgi:hypothetical protein